MQFVACVGPQSPARINAVIVIVMSVHTNILVVAGVGTCLAMRLPGLAASQALKYPSNPYFGGCAGVKDAIRLRPSANATKARGIQLHAFASCIVVLLVDSNQHTERWWRGRMKASIEVQRVISVAVLRR
ncbi:hypothetical protein CSC75_18080 [Pseudoxanthomonas wuyuanensis]|nr:hypothetical protein CSC75_18080 [Pseudoxanthomonas wuyuanensis]